MLNRLLSHDLPRSRWLAIALVLIVLAWRSRRSCSPAARRSAWRPRCWSSSCWWRATTCCSATPASSASRTRCSSASAPTAWRSPARGWAPSFGAVALGIVAALAISLVLSLRDRPVRLRVKAIFYAMITLAVAAAFQTLASQLSDFTGGEDGLTFKNPTLLSPSFEPFENPLLGVTVDGRLITYYLLFVGGGAAVPRAAAHRQLAVRPRAAGDPRERLPRRGDRLPHGGVPHAEQRARRRCSPRWPARCWRCGCATPGPTPRCSFEIMLDILLIVVIGGMGTLYGAVVGSVLFVFAQNYLQDLLKVGQSALGGEGVPPVLSPAGVARPLAAVAGRAVRAVGLSLPERHRRALAQGAGGEAMSAARPLRRRSLPSLGGTARRVKGAK